jgi:ADP-heptose:LPS heptosyltransferase
MPIANKEWFPERMQTVVDALRTDVEIVQLGGVADPPLEGVADLRGRTTIREAAAMMQSARVFIGLVGFLMHLARAVGTPSVILFGGREHPEQSGYPENRNLFTTLHCSPCWLWNQCPYERECMRRITADEVIAAAREMMAARST